MIPYYLTFGSFYSLLTPDYLPSRASHAAGSRTGVSRIDVTRIECLTTTSKALSIQGVFCQSKETWVWRNTWLGIAFRLPFLAENACWDHLCLESASSYCLCCKKLRRSAKLNMRHCDLRLCLSMSRPFRCRFCYSSFTFVHEQSVLQSENLATRKAETKYWDKSCF